MTKYVKLQQVWIKDKYLNVILVQIINFYVHYTAEFFYAGNMMRVFKKIKAKV